MSLAQRCSHEFQPGDRRRGEDYHAQGRCQLGPVEPFGTKAQVAGSGRAVYDVAVDWSVAALDECLLVWCACPRFADGLPCKHLWATLRTLDESGIGRRVHGSGPLDLIPDPELMWVILEGDDAAEEEVYEDEEQGYEDEEDWGWELEEDLFAAGGAGEEGEAPGRQLPRRGWRRQVDGVRSALEYRDEVTETAGTPHLLRHREAWFLLDIPACLAENRLMVDLHQRQERKSGEMGKVKSLTVAENEIGRGSSRRPGGCPQGR